jgi:hypothetical protein
MWLSIAVFLIDCLLILGCAYLTGNHLTLRGTLLYPLLLHFHNGDFPGTEIVLGLLGIGGMLISTLLSSNRRALLPILSLLVVPLCAGLCGLASGFIDYATNTAPLTPMAAIQSDGNTYQLVVDSCIELDSICQPPAYLVFKCDSLSLVCHLIDIPLQEPKLLSDIEAGSFRIDSGDHQLYVTIGTQEYPVVERFGA